MSRPRISGGHLVVECLKQQGVDRVFCVPGESYLEVLDGLYDAGLDIVVARHEGGAAIMAEADGKMTGRPGVVMVTRGPGATNAAAGVHIASQDSTPMVLLAGHVARGMRRRDAFQEIDFRAVFGTMAKWVEEVDEAGRIPEVMSRAWAMAMSGRPGPVVIALPEDMLRETTEAAPAPRVEVTAPAPRGEDIDRFARLLREAARPVLILGGSRWDAASVEAVQRLAEAWDLPVGCTFRRQGLFDAQHSSYAGDIALGINPALSARIASADLLILLGTRFSEIASQGYRLLDIPRPRQRLVHVHPGAEELGRVYAPDLAINATPATFLAAAAAIAPASGWTGAAKAAHDDYLAWSGTPPAGVGAVTLSHVVAHLNDVLPRDAIICNGAGNCTIWLHRFYRYGPASQLAPTSGSMGYAMPAAVAAACRHPEREVVCLAGDGCFQMTGMEFGVAVQRGLKVRVLVADNASYGTIRMHQERAHPGRVVATEIANPDFAGWARSYGAVGLTVDADAEFADRLAAARAAEGPALIHLKLSPRDITPGRTVD